MKSFFKIIKYQLYLLQLENYELGRYFRLLFKKGFFPKEVQRKLLVWTAKAKALFLMAVGLHLLIIVGLLFWAAKVSPYIYIFAVLMGLFLFTSYFLLLTSALLLIRPFDFLAKQVIISQAKSKIKNLQTPSPQSSPSRGEEGGGGLKIIGIAGSYGKTTMKAVLTAVTSEKFKVKSTPESVNTPVGISRWILKEVDESTEIIIVEMGEHYRGDIRDICNIVQPDISVVTGINESHLERMGKMDTVVETVFEVVSGTRAGGMVVLNGDDKRVIEHYGKYVWPDMRVAQYQVSSIKYQAFDTEKLGWNITVDDVGDVVVNLLGEYALGDVDAAVKIAQSLGMNGEEIKRGIEKIRPVEHRLQPIKSAGDILVIDDAYNGNPDGVREAIKVLFRFNDRRKVFITPGLVEMGLASAEIHRAIGKELVGMADVVVLIRNSVTPWIEEGINPSFPPQAWGGIKGEVETSQKNNLSVPTGHLPSPGEKGGNKPQVIWYNTAQEAHQSLSSILKQGDVVAFQNDWGDNYV